MPLSEALAARHHANRPWWRRAAQSIEHRVPSTLRGRWALSLPAAVAVALVAIVGAAAGGWYLTRSQGTVVDVAAAGTGSGGGGGNAGEAASATQPPDDDHAMPTSDTGAANPSADARGTAGSAAGRDGACRPHAGTPGPPRAVPGPPRAVPDAPTGWNTRALRVVPVAAGPEAATTEPKGSIPNEKQSAARDGGRLLRAEAAIVLESADFPGPVSVLISREAAQSLRAPAARALASNDVAGPASVLIARQGPKNTAAQAANALASKPFATQPNIPHPVPTKDRFLANQARDAPPVHPPHEPKTPTTASTNVRQARSFGHRVHELPDTPMARWYRAPMARRYAEAMAPSAAKRQSCAPHPAMATSPAVAGVASAGEVVVDVEGKVAHPGIQVLAPGSRVYEALAAAGGALPGADVTTLDLARPVTDGEQLRVGIAGAPNPVVGVPQPQPSGGGGSRGKHGKLAQPVNLNTATLEQLETVPDVGPALAQRILDWRSEHGRFESVAQLRQVRGIGERKFADMRDSVTV